MIDAMFEHEASGISASAKMQRREQTDLMSLVFIDLYSGGDESLRNDFGIGNPARLGGHFMTEIFQFCSALLPIARCRSIKRIVKFGLDSDAAVGKKIVSMEVYQVRAVCTIPYCHAVQYRLASDEGLRNLCSGWPGFVANCDRVKIQF